MRSEDIKCKHVTSLYHLPTIITKFINYRKIITDINFCSEANYIKLYKGTIQNNAVNLTSQFPINPNNSIHSEKRSYRKNFTNLSDFRFKSLTRQKVMQIWTKENSVIHRVRRKFLSVNIMMEDGEISIQRLRTFLTQQ